MAVCPQCGQENPEGFRLCGMCGAPLAEPVPAEAEERKLVSVLFVDLVGHTSASDRADPEDVRARLRPYHTLLKREIERFGGTVEKFVGDAVMAVFGAPVAHEDDPERAVRSALRILEAVEELELEVRAAVATGEAVVSLSARPEQGEGIVAGDVVNTASRMQQHAPAGSLVVGEVTYRASRDAIEYEQLDPVTVKGKAEPLSIWRAIRARARFGVDAEVVPRTPFIGREHDLALLRNTYERTLGEEAIQLVTVVGEPGVGKTRLVAELAAFVDERRELVRWRQGRCLPYGDGITFWALGEIVKAEAGILDTDSPVEAEGKLETAVGAVVSDGAEREWLAARLAPLVGASTGASGSVDQGESFTAWRRFLEALAAQRPLALVVEDLHWADSALIEFLEHLVDWSTGVPLLVVCTGRPELYERYASWGGGKRNSNTISLSPLTGDETARLISALLSRAVLPADTQAALLERCGGNPLYAEEFVRMLTDRGVLNERGEVVGDGEIAVPETVQALIAARLDTLAPERKALLHDAAVVGKVFWPGAVASIGGADSNPVRQGLQELVRKELVRPARTSSVENEEEFAFWHALVRDVAYGQIPRAARAQKHRAAAEWIEGMAGERVADHAELLAEHYREALELTRATGSADTEELETRVARFLTLAGDRALHLDTPRAARSYGDALALVPEGTQAQAELLERRAKAASLLADPTASSFYGEAVEVFRRLGDDRAAAAAMAGLGGALWSTGETRESREVLLEALSLLEGTSPGPELLAVYDRLAGTAMTGGRAEESLAWAEKGLPLAEELGLVDRKLRLLQFIGSSRCMLGDPGGVDDVRRALELGLEAGIGPESALAYVNLAGFTSDAEGPTAGLAIYSDGIDFAERRGLAGFANWARGERVWPLFDLGEWDEVAALGEEVVPTSQLDVLVLTYRAYVLAWRSSTEEAGELCAELLPRAREIRDAQILVPMLVVAALYEALSERLVEALDLVDEAGRETEDKPAFRALGLPELARVCAAGNARDVLAGLLEGLGEFGLARWVHGIKTAQAVLTELEGHHDEAAARYEDAARRWDDFGSVFEHGHALLGRGRCLVSLGRSGEAAEDLRRARQIFSQLGARPLVTETDGWLSQAATG